MQSINNFFSIANAPLKAKKHRKPTAHGPITDSVGRYTLKTKSQLRLTSACKPNCHWRREQKVVVFAILIIDERRHTARGGVVGECRAGSVIELADNLQSCAGHSLAASGTAVTFRSSQFLW
jgi:hypothetical protein